MKTRKRVLALMLAIIMLFSMSHTAHAAYTPKYTDAAKTLYSLGLFKGTGTNADGTPIFALEQKATRMQGLVMLIRLLGKEADALAYTGACPFTDVPDWAKQYAAYAYDNGITNGTSATTFSAEDPLLGKAYVTFVLRALSYNDAAGDFSYDNALTKGAELGLIAAGSCTGNIYRDDCAYISLKALSTAMNGSKQTLAEKLVKDGVLPKDALKEGVLNDGLHTQTQAPVVNATEIPLDISNGTVYLDSQKIKAAFPETEYVIAWTTNNQEKRIATMPDPYRHYLSHMLINDYINFGKSLPSMFKEFGTMVTDGFTVGGGDSSQVVFIDLFDKNYNFIAYCAVTGDGSKVYPTTVCTEKYMDKLQADLAALKKVPTLKQGDVYLERTVTFYNNGTVNTSTRLRLDESKVSFKESQVDRFDLSGNSLISDISLKDSWYGIHARDDAKYYKSYKTADLTPNLPWLLNDEEAGHSRTLTLIDSNQNILAFASVKKAMSIQDFADFGDGKVTCTISEKEALDLLTKTANSVGGTKAETAKNNPYSDAALTKLIYLYRTKLCTKEEYVANITAWLNG